MLKWYKHTDMFIISKLDAKEKGDTQKTQIPSIKFSKNTGGKVDSYFLLPNISQ
jgi:hypothetical protein